VQIQFLLYLHFAVSDYVKNVEDCPGLEDRLSQYNTTYELWAGGREPLFPSHLTPSQIHQGIKSGKLLQGSFLASRENFLEGQVNVEGQDKMVSSYRAVSCKQ
jgi:exosome complex exonuclease DIS3/RRP44